MRGSMDVPEIGDDVVLGAGCVVVGDVTVGDGAAIGPNTVVVKHVNSDSHVVAAAPQIVLQGH